MKTTALRRALGTAVALGALGVGMLATASPASAAGRDGKADLGEFILFYNSYLRGSFFDLSAQDSNLYGDRFITTGAGQGEIVDNNAASYLNRDEVRWYVYTGTNAGGIEGIIPSYYQGNFSTTFKNAVSSVYWYKAR